MKAISKIRILNIGMLFLLVFTSGCYYDQVYIPEPEGDVSYSTDMQPFFDASCVSCHNGGGIPLNLSPGESYNALINGNYVNTANPASSLLYTKIDTGGSMESYSTATNTATTLLWIEQGAKDN